VRDDRTVHAEQPGRFQIVRYDRAGKWWIEYVAASGTVYRAVSLDEAVAYAVEFHDGLIHHKGRPGGSAFDRRLARRTP